MTVPPTPLLVLWDIDHTLIDSGTVSQQVYATAFQKALAAEMGDRAAAMSAEGRVLPGAVAALTALGAVPGVYQSVLTGDLRAIAELKMRAFGLDGHVDFRLGAYGEDAYERTGLPAHAFRRTERHLGRRHSGADTVIIGDTLRDIATARAAGAGIVAVTTGSHSAAELRAAGADVVLTDLSDTAAVLHAVTGGPLRTR
ncbi:HAD hydrolase-like protein [Planomonospora corallina]|uniref:HAD hydrolase-like protein n=1 Tax=Planomonospora corallina TaxID=1806052 RepID=A0ABV8I547_9ACTN